MSGEEWVCLAGVPLGCASGCVYSRMPAARGPARHSSEAQSASSAVESPCVCAVSLSAEASGADEVSGPAVTGLQQAEWGGRQPSKTILFIGAD